MEVMASGTANFRMPDPDGHREYLREHRARGLVDRRMTEQEAVSNLVNDGDYLCYDCTLIQRGPSALIREIIRQQKKDLWIGGRFTYLIVNLLVAGGCVGKIDVGYIGVGRALNRVLDEGNIEVNEWSNSAMTMRQLAGAMGIPFIPIRFFGGADSFEHSGAKLIKDPYTGKEVVVVPALNPDVGMVHVHQCDIYGNARVFGTSVSPYETAASSRKVIISTEEIIDTEEIRRDPSKTTIPYYLVDAVVEAPFGAHPGEVPGLYASDTEAVIDAFRASSQADPEAMRAYLDKNVYSVASHEEYLEKVVGISRLLELKRRATIKEGYYR